MELLKKNIDNPKKDIAFLLLTYGDHLLANNIRDYLMNGNIYVHPKYKDQVKSYLKDYIINTLVETDWGKCNIVEAELELIKEAYKNHNNKWFILMSDKCFPIVDYNILHNKLDEINKSIFYLTAYSYFKEGKGDKEVKNHIYKSSQFWILHRKDIDNILKYSKKYLDFYNKHSGFLFRQAACDEIFFLSLLKNVNNNYDFYNCKSTYSRWINLTTNSHPFVINKFTPIDIEDFKKEGSLFFRKISENFSINVYNPIKNNIKKPLFFLYFDIKWDNQHKGGSINNGLGTYMDLDKTIKYINDKNADIIIYYTESVKDILPKDLMKKSIANINIFFHLVDESYSLFKIMQREYINQWSNVELIKIFL